MGKYHTYAERLDTLAKQRFADYQKAEAELKRAKEEKRLHPMPTSSLAAPEYFVEAREAEISLKKAEVNFTKAKNDYQNTVKEAKAIRDEMLKEVTRDLAVKPEDLDSNTVELLRSGICSPSELVDIYNKAENVTTRRYIAKHVKELIADNPKMDTQNRQMLSGIVSINTQIMNPENYAPMKMFDSVNGVLTRCINNPSLIHRWEALTENTLSEM